MNPKPDLAGSTLDELFAGLLPDPAAAAAAADIAVERRLRRKARQHGLRLMRARTRNPRVADLGTYMLVDIPTGMVAACGVLTGFGPKLHDCERALEVPARWRVIGKRFSYWPE